VRFWRCLKKGKHVVRRTNEHAIMEQFCRHTEPGSDYSRSVEERHLIEVQKELDRGTEGNALALVG
jgi:hypothetical protein